MTGFKYSSPYSKIALLVATTDAVFCLVGFVSSFWQIGAEGGLTVGYGLWFRCVDKPVVENGTTTELECTTFDAFAGHGDKYDSSLRAARGLRFAAFICLCSTAFVGFFYIYAGKFHKRQTAFVLTVFAFAAVILGIGGLIVYGSSLVLPGFSLSWSFAMAVLTTIFAVPIAVTFTIELTQFGKKKSTFEDVQVEGSKQDARVHPSKENETPEPSELGAPAVADKRSDSSETKKRESGGAVERRYSLSEANTRRFKDDSLKQSDNHDDGKGSVMEPKRQGPVVKRQSSVVLPQRQGSATKPRRQGSTKDSNQKGAAVKESTQDDSLA